MWGLHLKKKGRWWHYYRSVPRNFHDVDARRLISFSLKTSDFSEAKLKAAQFSIQLDEEWQAAKVRGVSLVSQDAVEKYKAAAEVQKSFGFLPKPAGEILEAELVDRLRMLLKLVLSRLRSGLPTHLCGLSLESQGAFAAQR